MHSSEWKTIDNTLTRTFVLKDFAEAWAFMTEIAFAAEKMGHHPNWSNVYNKVEIKLFTHDAGNKVTIKDEKLAEKIDVIIYKYLS